jgi:ribosomal RNA-processing protein 1
MFWEGLFFMYWHSDKSIYQRDTSLKIAQLLVDLKHTEQGWSDRQKQWFEAGLYIFNKHWDKVDNFRIDKFLMLVRNLFSSSFQIFKATNYKAKDL